jgi:hypothetical protein
MQQAKLKRLTGEELDQLAINCSTAGEVRSPRHADGTGAAGLYHLESRAALRPTRPDLAQS